MKMYVYHELRQDSESYADFITSDAKRWHHDQEVEAVHSFECDGLMWYVIRHKETLHVLSELFVHIDRTDRPSTGTK